MTNIPTFNFRYLHLILKFALCVYFGFYSVLKIESHSAKVVGVRFTLLYGKAISKVEYYYVAEQPLLASKRIGSSLRKKSFLDGKGFKTCLIS